MQLKDFKKLVQFCRSAGVLTYKGEIEFTLSPEDPKLEKTTRRKLRKVENKVEETLAGLSEEDLLLYSSQGISGDV